MTVRIYVRASTKEQDAERALQTLIEFAQDDYVSYVENISGTKLNRPILNQLLSESNHGDILLVESVDRLSRLTQDDFSILKQKIKDKGLKLVIYDLPTTHINNVIVDSMTSEIMNVINSMLIDLLATMARLDNEKRRERIRQGIARSSKKATGKKADETKHNEIKKLLEKGLTKKQIATLAKVGIATVFRVQKSIKTE